MELRIERLDLKARGIAEQAGTSYVCDGALPGETVAVSRLEQRRRLAIVREYAVVDPVQARTPPACRYYNECGGCQLQHADYAAQLHYKQRLLEYALRRHGDVGPQTWQEPMASEPWHYRRRARLRVRALPDGELIIGFNRKRHSWLLDIAACEVLEARLQALLVPLHELVRQLSVRQRLPQIELACGDNECAVVLRHLQALTDSDRKLIGDFFGQHGVLGFTQAGGPQTAIPLQAEQEQALHYALPAHELSLAFGPTDFIQANASVNRLLVYEVIAQAQPDARDRILDLYSGVGNFSLPLARYAGSVVGVEAHAGLVLRARENARHNNIHNCEFIEADLCSWQAGFSFNKLILDPPREGAIDVIKRLPESGIGKIVYVSCDPKTLARDARYLVKRGGYSFSQARLVDMFPQTRHIETIAVFEK